MDNGKKVPTNSIAVHPHDDNVFLLACIDQYVRLYDRRMIGTNQQAYRRLCPHKLVRDVGSQRRERHIVQPHSLERHTAT